MTFVYVFNRVCVPKYAYATPAQEQNAFACALEKIDRKPDDNRRKTPVQIPNIVSHE